MKKKKTQYISREESWLEFNRRVLDRAFLESVPLLERVKFLAITASNLDEFMMVRFGGLSMMNRNSEVRDISGLSVAAQIRMIRDRVAAMQARQIQCLTQLEPLLAENGIRRLSANDLSDIQREFLQSQFIAEIDSTMTPIGVADAESMPFLAGLRLHLCVRLKFDAEQTLLKPDAKTTAPANPERDPKSTDGEDTNADPASESDPRKRFVIIPLPRNLPRVWSIPASDQYCYMLLEDIVAMFLDSIFDGQEVLDCTPFRITRNGDVVLVDDQDERADLLQGMEQVLEERKVSACVRLEISDKAAPETRAFLESALDVSKKDCYPLGGPLVLSDYFAIAGLNGFHHLKDKPWPSHEVPEFAMGSDIFATIAEKDRIVHHPYQSYDCVVNFIRTAAADERVIAIKQTLYRTARDSEIAKALEQAAANGKTVTCIVELKARFDEARNIEWAKRLEAAGIDVIYGVQGLKTHAKMCVVVRRETTGVQRYMHFGTGNYNETTARIYGDVSFFTSDEQLGSDAVHLFNAISGLSVPQAMGKIAAAPINLRETFLELIQLETENAKHGARAEIRVKVNSLVDRELIDALYEASEAGVKIMLNVRGMCCLLPGKKGFSENIQVVSVIDRFLEHSRIFYFYQGGDEKMFISSADWMGRNLDRRVELLIPIEQRECKSRLLKILNCYFNDSESARELKPDGSYGDVSVKKKKRIRSQEWLYEEAGEIFRAISDPKTTVFQPHRRG